MKPIIQPVRNCWSVEEVVESGILVDGRDYYRAFHQAAKEAKDFILIAGWQFDSDVALLRGDDAVDGEARFLPFLNSLCRKNPNLKIYILAWDYSALYTFEREPFQEALYRREADERIVFRMDGKHPAGASHHQKFVVIDGTVGFVGGQDLCSSRWDDRDHLAKKPERVNSDGSRYNPFHDIQAYLVGPGVSRLTELFKTRWKSAFGEVLDLSTASQPGVSGVIPSGLPVKARRVAISRTMPETLFHKGSIEEIRQLCLDAIHAAEQLIYMENQYFTSRDIFDALMDRMKAQGRNRLQIVLILPKSASALVEEVALIAAQSEMLKSLKETAEKTGHALGIYYTAATDGKGEEAPVYIHSKVFLVDDRFLSVGSANTTNRSMGLDTELNVSWEAAPEEIELARSIRDIRASLLCEHTGLGWKEAQESLSNSENLVDHLNEIAGAEGKRLRHHPIEIFLDKIPLLNVLKIKELSMDPSKPYPEMLLNRVLELPDAAFFAGGILSLNRLLSQGGEEDRKSAGKGGGSKTKINLGLAELDL